MQSHLTTLQETLHDNEDYTLRNTLPDGSTTEMRVEEGQRISAARKDADETQISGVTFAYDPHGRVESQTDARSGATTSGYDDLDRPTTDTMPPAAEGATAQVTSTEYNWRGQPATVTLPDTTEIEYEYFLTGELQKQSGSQTYTVEYTYDAQGRTKTMETATGLTTWNYDPERGWLDSKEDAEEEGAAYDYSPGGRQLTRTWARGVVTTYGYDEAGQLDSIDYSDSTPDVSFERDRAGSLIGQADGAGARVFARSANGQILEESVESGILDGVKLRYSYDELLRRKSLHASLGARKTEHHIDYDAASRIAAVGDGRVRATYEYVPNSSLIGSITVRQGNNAMLRTKKSWDKLNRLTSIRNERGLLTSASHYTYNSLNQRTSRTTEDGSYWDYGYDTLGQVTSGVKKLNGEEAISGYNYGYAFDGIGNRTGTTTNGASATYTSNNLNQYESRTVPGKIDVVGTARAEASVSVNDQSAGRQGRYFHKQLSVTNTSDPVLEAIDVGAVNKNRAAEAADVIEQEQGEKFVPKTPEAFGYDLDGNCTGDGRWDYSWDGENRLVSLIAKSSVPSAGKKKLLFAYDGNSRRIRKQVFEWNEGESDYEVEPAVDIIYLYDGWNLIGELDQASQTWCSYLWGLDLSGSMQGTGGVGGLLAATINHQVCTYSYDGNGNVVALTDGNGHAVASYEYGPFGEMIRANGSLVNFNPFSFSTKYCDLETGCYYYGLRFYNPSTGRWLNRDPIEEDGGPGLYAFASNSPIDLVDPLGMQEWGGVAVCGGWSVRG